MNRRTKRLAIGKEEGSELNKNSSDLRCARQLLISSTVSYLRASPSLYFVAHDTRSKQSKQPLRWTCTHNADIMDAILEMVFVTHVGRNWSQQHERPRMYYFVQWPRRNPREMMEVCKPWRILLRISYAEPWTYLLDTERYGRRNKLQARSCVPKSARILYLSATARELVCKPSKLRNHHLLRVFPLLHLRRNQAPLWYHRI